MKILKTKTIKLDRFDGTVVFGLSKQDTSKMVAVYRKGAVLNDKQFKAFNWTQAADIKSQVRNYFVGSPEMMTKSEIKKEMNISNLTSSQKGHSTKYKDTPIGDVLYVTYGTYRKNWTDAIQQGFFDKACSIYY